MAKTKSIVVCDCKHCGKHFSRVRWRANKARFCSRLCCAAFRKRLPMDRFLDRVKKHPNGCILWTGFINSKGYGNFQCFGSKTTIAAHRAAYEMFVGPIIAGLFVCHRCDNPICVNPTHLFLGTHKDNMADMVQKRRIPSGSRSFKAKLTWDKVAEIRRRHAAGEAQNALAREFGVHATTVGAFITGTGWRIKQPRQDQ